MIEVRRTRILRGAAQVSEGTIYNYFKNKHDLRVAMLNLLGADVFKGMAPANPAKNPYGREHKMVGRLG